MHNHAWPVSNVHVPARAHIDALQRDFAVEVTVTPMQSRTITYGGLAALLQFGGTEVLDLDAEGHDCTILQSMIEHCHQSSSSPAAWPDIICFETQTHQVPVLDKAVAFLNPLLLHLHDISV